MNTIKSVKFNYDTNTFDVNNFPSEVEQVKQWVELLIKVEKDKYKIYNENFGMDFSDIVGYRLPRSVQVSEIIRRLKRTIINGCDHVTDVRDFTFDKGTFTFTLITDLGEEVILHV
nr:MAG TPA: Protein of unknown function (DUF2634) [Caudoviricetes sp.]